MDCQDASQVIDLLEQASVQNRLDAFRSGHLLKLPDYGQVIMTGDLHGCLDNFRKIQWFADLNRCMDRHVLIHELIHTNGQHAFDDRPSDEDSSFLLLLEAMKWKIDYPEQVHFLLGNHDLAQSTDREISKGGAASIANFNKWIFTHYGDKSGAVIVEKVREFLFTIALAARCPNRIWMSHSLPGTAAMNYFDFSIFEREWEPRDLVPKGSVYETVWGRSHPPALLHELSTLLNVDYFVLGHQSQEQGFDTQAERAIILASDHGQGCFLPIDLSRRYTFDNLVTRIKFFSELPEPRVA